MRADSKPHPDPPRRIGRGMLIVAWLAGLGLLSLLFSTVLEREHNPNHAVLTRADAQGRPEIVLQRNRAGHYVVSGRINDQPVQFLVDTGATDVAIPAPVAQRLGLQRGVALRFETANGAATGYHTRLASLSIGPLVLHDIPASINPGYQAEDVLLGMSVLRHLEFTQRGDTLILRPGRP